MDQRESRQPPSRWWCDAREPLSCPARLALRNRPVPVILCRICDSHLANVPTQKATGPQNTRVILVSIWPVRYVHYKPFKLLNLTRLKATIRYITTRPLNRHLELVG